MKRYFLTILALLFSCVYLDSVTQPSAVTIGEEFTMVINGNYYTYGWGGGTPWLAIMLPNGFLIDSIQYAYTTNDTFVSIVSTPDSSLVAYIESVFPCDSNMHWHGYWGEYISLPSESTGTYTATVYAIVTDSTLPGTYLIDYLSGCPGYNSPDISDSIFDQPILVTETAVGEISENHARKGNAVWPTIFRNGLNILTENADLIEIFSNDGRLVKSLHPRSSIQHLESALVWQGDDHAGRKLPSGVYFVQFVSGDYEETEKVLLVR